MTRSCCRCSRCGTTFLCTNGEMRNGWLVGCFGFNGPLRQYFSLYRAISQREGERRERIDESKNVQTTPTRTCCKRNRPLPYCNQNCRTPRHWKFTQHHRTTRPPLEMRNGYCSQHVLDYLFPDICGQRTMTSKGAKRNAPHLLQAQQAPVCLWSISETLQCRMGWSGGAMVLGKLPVPGRPTIWMIVGQGPIALAVGAGGGGLDILLSSFLSLLFLPLSRRRPDIN